MQLTKVHKIRIFLGVNGQMTNSNYTYSAPKWGNIWFQKKLYKFMFRVGNPLLNFLLRGKAFKK